MGPRFCRCVGITLPPQDVSPGYRRRHLQAPYPQLIEVSARVTPLDSQKPSLVVFNLCAALALTTDEQRVPRFPAYSNILPQRFHFCIFLHCKLSYLSTNCCFKLQQDNALLRVAVYLPVYMLCFIQELSCVSSIRISVLNIDLVWISQKSSKCTIGLLSHACMFLEIIALNSEL